MNRKYLVKHWLATLILAQFLPTLYELFNGSVKGQVTGLLEMFAVTFAFSLVFSIPTLVVYYFIFLFLIRRKANPILTKAILIVVTVGGIVTTVLMIGGSMTEVLIYAFSIAAIVSGILIKITNKTDSTQIIKPVTNKDNMNR